MQLFAPSETRGGAVVAGLVGPAQSHGGIIAIKSARISGDFALDSKSSFASTLIFALPFSLQAW